VAQGRKQHTVPGDSPCVNPEAGIGLLERQKEKGYELLASGLMDSGSYAAWENTTRHILVKCFGSDSRNIASVMNIGKSGPRPAYPNEEWREWHRSVSLEAQLKMLDSCIEQLQMEIAADDAPLPQDGCQLSLSSLHPTIRERCKLAFETKQYDNAILDAFKTVEEEIRSRIGGSPDDFGVSLVSKAMNPKSPLLVFSDVNAEQEAFHSLYRGAIGSFKNPRSHRFLETADPESSFELLAVASLLMRLLDDAKSQVN